MKFERTFSLEESEATAIFRIKEYLEQAGYKFDASSLRYRRGSLLGSLTSFSPRKWKACIVVATQTTGENETQITLNLDVNTTGQIVTTKEYEFWITELDSIENAACSGQVNVTMANKASQEATSNALKIVLLWIGISLAVGVPIGLLAVVITGKIILSNIGLVGIGAGYILVWKRYCRKTGLINE